MTDGAFPGSGSSGAPHVLELDGMRHAYVRYGSPLAPAVLCVHGWLDNAASFAPLAEQLPGVQLIALELAGHGHSDHRAQSEVYHYLDWVRDVLRVADALGLRELSLMGHSMGAGICALAAGTEPQRVRRLVLLEGTAPRPTAAHDLPIALARQLELERKTARIPIRTRPAAFDIALRARLSASPLSTHAAELLTRRGTIAQGAGVLWRNDRRLSVLLPGQLDEAQILAFLRRIACPTLRVAASAGIPYDPALMRERLASIGDLRDVEVEGRHHVHMDDPKRVAAHVGAFLQPG